MKEVLEETNGGEMTIAVERPQADALRTQHNELFQFVQVFSFKRKGSPIFFIRAGDMGIYLKLVKVFKKNHMIVGSDGRLLPPV